MDKNSIIGLVLIFLILIVFAYINQPGQEELAAQQRRQDSIAMLKKSADSLALVQTNSTNNTSIAPAISDSAAAIAKYGAFAALAIGNEDFTVLENNLVKITFTNKGARIYSVQLKPYKRYDGSDLILFTGSNNRFDYTLRTKTGQEINSSDLFFTPAIAQDGKSVVFTANFGLNQYITHTYSLTDNDNLVAFKLNFSGLNDLLTANQDVLPINWLINVPKQEKTYEAEQRTTTIYYKYQNEEPDYLSETSDKSELLPNPVQWLAFKQQYFNQFLIAENTLNNVALETKTDVSQKYIKQLKASFSLPFNANASYQFKYYFGSNEYKPLAALGISAERIIPMGWGIFRWVNKYLTVNVFYWLGQYITNMGLIIFLLTFIVKTILFPLVYKSYLSSAKMRILKPELDEIKEKYGNDMAKIQQETMKIYRQAGVNPMGGCIPVLLQMPILIAMFQFFPSAFDLRQKAFLWSEDLSTYDSVFNLPFYIPFYGDHVSLFTLLMTVSTLIYTIYNNEMTGVTGQMKWLSYLMPVMFLGFFNNYASGLTYYYFVSNLFTIGQQLAIRSFVNESKLHAQIQEHKKKPVVKSKLQQKLEDMAKKRGFDPSKMRK